MSSESKYQELEKQIADLSEKLIQSEQRFKRLLETIEISERRHWELIKNSSDTIVILNANGIQTYVSDAAEKHLGFKPDELLNIPVIETMIHPDDQEKTRQAFQTVLTEGKCKVQYRHRHKNGSWVYLEALATNQLDNPDIEGIVVNVRNITQWKKTQKALTSFEERYQLIEDNITDVIWTMDLDLNYTYLTPSIKGLRGYTQEEVISQKIEDRVTPESLKKIHSLLQKKARGYQSGESCTAKIVDFETQQKCKDGSVIWTQNKVQLLRGPDNEPIGFLGTTRDISDWKKAENEKFKAQKSALEYEKYALVGQIAGKMSHDFNNILGAIMGNTELAMLDCTDEKTSQTLQLILEQTIRGRNLTKNLVAFAKDQEPKQEFFSLNEKIDLVLNLLKKDLQKVEVIKTYIPGLSELLADPGMIEHCIVNLIQNSIHATGKCEKPVIHIQTFSKNKQICVDIQDNGCGIPEEAIDRIFEPAFTLKGSRDMAGAYLPEIKGTGYGMANVKKYMEQHKGEILIRSKEGQGTRITLMFPEIQKELTKNEISTIKETLFSTGKRILLVEDEPAISDVQYRILTKPPCSHKVDLAANGQMAIDLIDRNTYDFVSLDYVLPGGISGMDVYAHLRKMNSRLPVLFISGNLEFLESVQELKHRDPYIDHLSKPCQNRDYIQRIHQLMNFLT